ncbi:MAG: helix-turn-helix domain-containing protein [Planctomycetota bacterium]|nr:MAG: helix-turn-helix domain-containing protein [Planctomycetota bacterium]
MSTKIRPPLFERLQTGLQESIAHVRGEMTLRTTLLPEEPPEIDNQTIFRLRERAMMSQAIFARVLNVSPKTVQSWEQGVRQPSESCRRLIQIFSLHPEMVCQTVGLPPVALTGVTIQRIGKTRTKIVIDRLPSRKRLPCS